MAAAAPSHEDIIRTLKARIKEIDLEVSLLRERQKGLELALSIVLGETALVTVERAGKGKVQ